MARRGPGTEADRMRLHNEEFRFALANNITILQARSRLAQRRMAELEQRVHPPLKPGCEALCGTEAPELAGLSSAGPHYWWEDRD